MAVKPYESDQSIHSMTTRQLRQYISDKATEAQTRLDTLDLDTSDRAVKEAIDFITGRSGKVKRSTSNMDKAEMREYAYALRTFNLMDEDSGFAKRTEWQKNKDRYEKFIRNRINEDKNSYWKQYLTEKGNVSKRGYEDYKEYIDFIKSIQDVKYQYTYKTLTKYATGEMGADRAKLKDMSKILNKVYKDSKGMHLTTSQLVDKFNQEWEDFIDKSTNKASKPKSIPSSKRKKQRSSSNVKTKTVGKMKTNVSVHR